jgi:hypothetical protein
VFAPVMTTHAIDPSAVVFTANLIAWQDVLLVGTGVLLLAIARLVVYRRRRGEDEYRIPLIQIPSPPPPGQPRPVWPAPGLLERHEPEQSTPNAGVTDVEEWGEEVRAGPVRFHRPPEGTLQLLPGRLEIVSGNEGVEEIRFVKVPGKEPLVTFGRSSGEPHTHIELQSPTVSRKHAVMRFYSGSWHIENLSRTNPIVVAGKQLALNGAPVRLVDGDEVEMGEVTFRYHAR